MSTKTGSYPACRAASLDFLDPVIGVLERLIVTNGSCTDSCVLSRAVGLAELDPWTDEQHLDHQGLWQGRGEFDRR